MGTIQKYILEKKQFRLRCDSRIVVYFNLAFNLVENGEDAQEDA